jgi:hypothetical protein
VSLNPHGPHVERVYEGQIVDVPLQDGASYVRGVVVEADVSFFVVELGAPFAGRRERYDQGMLGVVLVSDG